LRFLQLYKIRIEHLPGDIIFSVKSEGWIPAQQIVCPNRIAGRKCQVVSLNR